MTVVRVNKIENMDENLLPFQWMGKNIGFIEQAPGGGDVDYEWQWAAQRHWLNENGVYEK